MKAIITISLLLLTVTAFSQMRPIDTSDFSRVASLERPAISYDGNYVLYTISNQPFGSSTLVIREVNSARELQMKGATNAVFSSEGTYVSLVDSAHTLTLVRLNDFKASRVAKISRCTIWRGSNADWIAYYEQVAPKRLHVFAIGTSQETISEDVVSDCYYDTHGAALVQHKSKAGDTTTIDQLDLMRGTTSEVWRGQGMAYLLADLNHRQAAWTLTAGTSKSFWLLNSATEKPVCVLQSATDNYDATLKIISATEFSPDGQSLFVRLSRKNSAVNPDNASVDIWSYHDAKVQSLQLSEIKSNPILSTCTSILSLKVNQPIKLLHSIDETLLASAKSYRIYKEQAAPNEERNWNPGWRGKVWKVSLIDGHRTALPGWEEFAANQVFLSPDERTAIIYSPRVEGWLVYDMVNGQSRPITGKIKTEWTIDSDRPDAVTVPCGVAGWMGDSAVILYDRKDIWLVSLNQKYLPKNLTGSKGKTSDITFRRILPKNSSANNLITEKLLILCAFDNHSKDNGFYSLDLSNNHSLTKLTMSPHLYFAPESQLLGNVPGAQTFAPIAIAAEGSKRYLVRSMNESTPANYWVTQDFIHFQSASNLQADLRLMSLKTELLDLKTPKGEAFQCILYKPANFDPRKKYPVIFHYYERASDGLHAYLEPAWSAGTLNIPWFVSQGYLVCTPDIHYTIGEPGNSALAFVDAAATALSKLSFIDAKKMGLQGHSFGGYETNYIVTHSNRFRAAAAASGVSDLVENYSTLWGGDRCGDKPRAETYEQRQFRMGGTPWQLPGLYRENSPLLYADKVSTPLLLMHNINDGNVNFQEGLGFFLALRRLGKTAWLLQYDKGDHVLYDAASAKDYTLRMKQFFDYYLQGAAPPEWMIEGIPAFKKGVVNGLEPVPKNTPLRSALRH